MNAATNSGKLKVGSMIFGWAWSKIAMVLLVHETLKSAVNEFMKWADFLNADSVAIIFG